MLAIGPNGWWIDARLGAADDPQRALVPTEWLADTTDSLWLVFHQQDGWQMAFYLEPGSEEMAWARAMPAQASGRFERLLPQLEVPRLFLRADVYRSGQGSEIAALVDPSTLAVDSAEIFYNALLDAHLHLGGSEAWTEGSGQRAATTMDRVPESHRDEAFRSAALDLGSHVLSVASEIRRLAQRRDPAALCAVLNHPATIFAAWRRAFGDGQFPGRWQKPGDPETGRPGQWVTSRDVLTADDRRWFVRSVLGASWTGDPRHDFAALCAAAEHAERWREIRDLADEADQGNEGASSPPAEVGR